MLQKDSITDVYRLLLFVLLFFALLLPMTEQLNAQNLQRMNIERVEAGTGIPVFTQHPDKAGIVIESSVPGLRFSSNMQGIVEVREPASGRYVLIIEPFTQIIRVDAENFVQERFRVGNPQARDVLYFSVSPERQQSDLISVIFNVEPEDALLFLNGQQVETNTTVQLPTQGYELRLEREGYRSINEVVNITPENIQFNYSMEEIDIVPVRIRSNVEGARVIIDGTERGEVDRSGTFGIFLFPGTYNFSLQAPGFVSANEVLEVGETSDNQFEIRMTENIGFLEVDILPAAATLRVNGEQQMLGENGQISLSPGSYELEITADGYLSYQEEITVELGETVQRDVELVRNAGTLQLDITPAQAVLRINGERQTLEENGQISLIPGSYDLEITSDGHLSYKEEIIVELGENIQRNVDLVKNTAILQFDIMPADAALEINRQSYNPYQQVVLAPGRYRIEIFEEGFESYSENIDVQRGDIVKREIVLEMQTGALQFSVVPGNAEVILKNLQGNEVDRWEGLNFVRNLQVGTYFLDVSADEHLPQQERITITKDETLEIQLELNEGSSFHTEIVDVYNPATGRTWMDRNLGASRVATSPTDKRAYGYLYQWGRTNDEHEKRYSPNTSTLTNIDQPDDGKFILVPNGPYDWRSERNNDLWQGEDGINNPCPSGYRLPTEDEWEAERQSWSSKDAAGAYGSPLKLPLAGFRSRSSGSIFLVDSVGNYWASSVSGSDAMSLNFLSSNASLYSSNRAHGFSVRCIKD
jgi:uncharacterized protein (TIGR02145 family)